jgi:hypothetical protein
MIRDNGVERVFKHSRRKHVASGGTKNVIPARGPKIVKARGGELTRARQPDLPPSAGSSRGRHYYDPQAAGRFPMQM